MITPLASLLSEQRAVHAAELIYDRALEILVASIKPGR